MCKSIAAFTLELALHGARDGIALRIQTVHIQFDWIHGWIVNAAIASIGDIICIRRSTATTIHL